MAGVAQPRIGSIGHHIPVRSGVIFWIAKHRWVTLVGVAVFSFLFVLQGALRRWPLPSNMDEFSMLVAANTFAHGRVTNSTPALWQHFETLHVIMTPTYTSKYPAAPALMLALGERIFGDPIWGLWLATALACAAITWMLLAWMPIRWALIGGLLAALHPLIVSWGRFYLCCNLGVLGGALILGSAKRLLRRRTYRYSVVLALGIALLINVRPYEGTALTIGVLGWMLYSRIWREPNSVRMLLASIGPILLVTAAAMGFYNWRVTGSPLKLPYSVHAQQYDPAPGFWFLPAHAKWEYRHDNLLNFHVWELNTYLDLQQPSMRWKMLGQRVLVLFLWLFDLSMIGLLWGWKLIRQRWTWPLLSIGTLLLFAFLLPTWMNSNYVSCAIPLYFILLTACLRAASRFVVPRTRLVIGPLLIGILMLGTLAWALQDLEPFDLNDSNYGYTRAGILHDLEKYSGRNLIFVRYAPNHPRAEEWIYNDGDIAHARTIWAHDQGEEANQELIQQYGGRELWLVEPDIHPVQLIRLNQLGVSDAAPHDAH
jgi:hypothetical protein